MLPFNFHQHAVTHQNWHQINLSRLKGLCYILGPLESTADASYNESIASNLKTLLGNTKSATLLLFTLGNTAQLCTSPSLETICSCSGQYI